MINKNNPAQPVRVHVPTTTQHSSPIPSMVKPGRRQKTLNMFAMSLKIK